MDSIYTKIIGALLIGFVVGYTLKGGMPASSPTPTPTKKVAKEMTKPTSKEDKIKNAQSAATSTISKEATVLDWPEKEGAELATLQKGSNGWTCLPDYPGSPGNDPMCVDGSGMVWMQAYLTQKKPKLAQAGIGYMLQGGSDASNTDPFATKPAKGEDWVTAPAHIMVFPSGDLDPKVYGTDPKTGNPWIMFSGTPYEHLMVPVK